MKAKHILIKLEITKKIRRFRQLDGLRGISYINLNEIVDQLLLIGLILLSTIFFSNISYNHIKKHFYDSL